MRRRLIRDRVTLASIVVLAVGLGILGIATNVVLTQQLSRDASALLRERTDSQLAAVQVHNGQLELERVHDGTLDRQSWAYSHGRAVERPVTSAKLQRAADSLARVRRATERTVGESTRLRATPVRARNGARVGTVVVAASLAPYEHSERIARIATAILSLLVLALGALVARRAVGAALHPVADMAASAQDWSEHDLSRRLELGPPRDELTSLAATLDDLLGRIDAAMRHEQRLSAEMAHELRTPLSGVRAEAELALRSPGLPGDARDSLGAILTACDRMATVIEALLTAARSPQGAGSSDPVAAAREVVRSFDHAATVAGVEVVLNAPARPLQARADHEQVTQALSPLLENAISHAAARVSISIGADNGHVALAVEDDGPGLPADFGASGFEPGASSRGSAGLGLPLARRLARSCGGDVIAASTPRGARFELRIPRAISSSRI